MQQLQNANQITVVVKSTVNLTLSALTIRETHN
jgi:hypothetical protein